MQKDKKKRLWKVAKELIKDPLLTTRELEKKTWISKSAIANYINNDLDTFGQKDDRILWVCETDFEIVKLWQAIIKNRLQDEEEVAKMRTFEIAQTIEKSEKRYQIFKWDITDKNWWLKEINISEEQQILLLDRMNKLYGKRND